MALVRMLLLGFGSSRFFVFPGIKDALNQRISGFFVDRVVEDSSEFK
jgi:hypothetical protein